MARTVSGDKTVVTGSEIGSLFPTNREEIYREIVIDGRAERFDLRKAVYSKNLEILGGGTIHGPVFAGETVRCESSSEMRDPKKDVQILLSGVTARKNIITESKIAVKFPDSLAAKLYPGLRFLIRGDLVAGDRVSLTNTCVIGSIKAPNVDLQSSIVFGAISADSINSICSTISLYHSNTIEFVGPNSVLTAGGLSKDKPACKPLNSETGPVGEMPREFGLRFIPACRVEGVGCQMSTVTLNAGIYGKVNLTYYNIDALRDNGTGIPCGAWFHDLCPFIDNVRLGPLDFYQLPTDVNSFDSESKGIDVESENDEEDCRGYWVLGLQGRALSLDAIKEKNDQFLRRLRGIFAYEHLSPEQRLAERDQWESAPDPEKDLLELTAFALDS